MNPPKNRDGIYGTMAKRSYLYALDTSTTNLSKLFSLKLLYKRVHFKESKGKSKH